MPRIDEQLARAWLKVVLEERRETNREDVVQANAVRLMQTIGCADLLNPEHPVVRGINEVRARNIAALTPKGD